MNSSNLIINKTMDFEDLKSSLDSKKIISELNDLIFTLKSQGLKYSSWYGTLAPLNDKFERLNRGYNYKPLEGAADDKNIPWFLYWEIVHIFKNVPFKKQDKILDMGGSSSLFSYYLACKGYDMTTIEINKSLVENANLIAKKMGWNLKNHFLDMNQISFNYKFDKVTSICVYEHLPVSSRIAINQKIKNLLVKDGFFCLTFDYKNPCPDAMINSEKDIFEQFIKPSGLSIFGNKKFFDNGKRYLFYPSDNASEQNHYTFGALFLRKETNNHEHN